MAYSLFSGLSDSLADGDTAKIVQALNSFCEEASTCFEFSDVTTREKRMVADSFTKFFVSTSSLNAEVLKACLNFVRILSRDQEFAAFLSDNEALIERLFATAGFIDEATKDVEEEQQHGKKNGDYDRRPTATREETLSLEAKKCLSNLLFHSEASRKQFKHCGTLQSDLQQSCEAARDESFFTMRVIFVLSALEADCRAEFVELGTHRTILAVLKHVARSRNSTMLNSADFPLVIESLKTLFNLLLILKSKEVDQETEFYFADLSETMRDYILIKTDCENSWYELINNVVNLLTEIPVHALSKTLVFPVDSEARETYAYDGFNMVVIEKLLAFLSDQCDKVPKLKQHLISPILTVLTDLADDRRVIRKYLRQRILPFLRDVYRRPEVGSTFRNKVVRLMTSVTDVSQLAADFLFILCKRNVERFIKYTGFGNAIGMLSARCFLVPEKRDPENGCSPDEDSETDEYAKVKDFINPVTGCYEAPKPSLTAEMSEEQKEYEAMELVKNIDKLMKEGVVTPGTIGEDGRVHPIEHILELRETDLKQHIPR